MNAVVLLRIVDYYDSLSVLTRSYPSVHTFQPEDPWQFPRLFADVYDAYIFSTKLPVLLCVHPLISRVYET